MRTIRIGVSTGLLALFTLMAHPVAQVLSSAEVHKLMESKQPGDHTKLQAHFAALSARYTADANRHKAFARAAAAAPRGGAAASKHHDKLAELASESAKVTGELATHHGTLAAGKPSTAPKGGEKFEAGAGAPATPSEKHLLELAAKAATPAEHGELREYYTKVAAQYAADAKEHRAMAQMYRGLGRTNESAAAHCDRLVKLGEDSAAEARALASEHQRLATGA